MAKPNARDRSSKPAPGDTRPVALGELGLVATPIGNLGDLSARAACIDSVYDEVHDALTARSVMAKAQSTEIARR